MHVHVHPVTPDRLPENASAIVLIDHHDDVHLYYDYAMPLTQRCAYADLALTAGVNRLIARLIPRRREA